MPEIQIKAPLKFFFSNDGNVIFGTDLANLERYLERNLESEGEFINSTYCLMGKDTVEA